VSEFVWGTRKPNRVPRDAGRSRSRKSRTLAAARSPLTPPLTLTRADLRREFPELSQRDAKRKKLESHFNALMAAAQAAPRVVS
jgi:hypothetical protein